MLIDDITNHRFLVNFTKYRNLLIELVKRDIKIKYRRFYSWDILEFFRAFIIYDSVNYHIFNFI